MFFYKLIQRLKGKVATMDRPVEPSHHQVWRWSDWIIFGRITV